MITKSPWAKEVTVTSGNRRAAAEMAEAGARAEASASPAVALVFPAVEADTQVVAIAAAILAAVAIRVGAAVTREAVARAVAMTANDPRHGALGIGAPHSGSAAPACGRRKTRPRLRKILRHRTDWRSTRAAAAGVTMTTPMTAPVMIVIARIRLIAVWKGSRITLVSNVRTVRCTSKKLKRDRALEAAGRASISTFRRKNEISMDDKEVDFSTKVGATDIKAKFTLKDMRYHGKLAL